MLGGATSHATQIIRVRGPAGTARIEAADTDSLSTLTQKVGCSGCVAAADFNLLVRYAAQVREHFKLEGQQFSLSGDKHPFTPRDLPRSLAALKIKYPIT